MNITRNDLYRIKNIGLTLFIIGGTGVAAGDENWQMIHATLAVTGLFLLIITALKLWHGAKHS